MGGLAHYLEEDGLATTQISLIRLHSEKTRPPRALWVPFELGRPLGPPNDAPFQRRVLMAVLELLKAPSGPLLTDYAEDAPKATEAEMEGWVCPINLAPPALDSDGETPEHGLDSEMKGLWPWYDLAMENRSSSNLGASGLTLEKAREVVLSFAQGEQPDEAPVAGVSIAEGLRLAVDDIKAFYVDAATAQPGNASGRDIQDWFWRETAFAGLLQRLRKKLMASTNEELAQAGEWLLVPSSHWLEESSYR
ncbi:MAG: hypothetical protein QF767_06140 [Alphaproteobacteria bacterium]|nr:hypothetical protein [Alphaproteobacteria bacterium]